MILRLIGKWLNAGVMEGSSLSHPEAGTPQGGVVSPLLAKLYLHGVGLELRVRSDAGAVLKRLAQEIHVRHGAKAQDGESAGADDGGGNPTQVEMT